MGADPRYAMAHVGLAEAYWHKALGTGDQHWADRALESARRAVELDGNLVMARYEYLLRIRVLDFYTGAMTGK